MSAAMAGPHRNRVRDRLARVLRTSPHLSTAQAATVVGCHPSTAARHAKSLHQARGQQRVRLHPVAVPSNEAARRRLAGNSSIQPRLIARLATDNRLKVRVAAASNPNCPKRALRRLLFDPSVLGADSSGVFAAQAGNLVTAPALLIPLALRTNPNCPPLIKNRQRLPPIVAALYP